MFFISSDENETDFLTSITPLNHYIFERCFPKYHDNITDSKPGQCNQLPTHDNH